MKQRLSMSRFLIVILVFFLLIPTTVWGNDALSDQEEVYNLIKSYHINPGDLQQGTIDEMLKQLGDPYTQFFTKEDYESYIDDLDGSFTGIGMFVEEKDGFTFITMPMKDSPAEKAGLLKGDKIIAVDDVPAEGLPIEEITARVKGKEGTKVKLTVLREGKELSFVITRAKIQLPIVDYGIFEDEGIGYIHILTFGDTSYQLVLEALDFFRAEGVEKVILDLRGNPGGRLDTVLFIANLFVDGGPIVWLKDGDGFMGSYKAKEGVYWDKPIVLLTDAYSASASEVLAGALKDYGMATVIGDRTFGKGTVQTFVQLDSGNYLKLTIEEYFSPVKNKIDKIGVPPHITVVDPEEQFTVAMEWAKGIQQISLGAEGQFVINDKIITNHDDFAIYDEGWYLSLYRLNLIINGELYWEPFSKTTIFKVGDVVRHFKQDQDGVIIKDGRMYIPFHLLNDYTSIQITTDEQGNVTISRP